MESLSHLILGKLLAYCTKHAKAEIQYDELKSDEDYSNVELELIKFSPDFTGYYIYATSANDITITSEDVTVPLASFKLICTYKDGEVHEQIIDVNHLEIKVGYTTKSGYFSKKKLPVDFEYRATKYDSIELTDVQLVELLPYINFDARENTYDPRWYENELSRRNASGYAFFASRLTDEIR